ncbi:MAG: protein-export protein SecB [Nitrosomonas sp.]|nr:MAG: protein-export protein SecB [Nitrosomonas sp.]
MDDARIRAGSLFDKFDSIDQFVIFYKTVLTMSEQQQPIFNIQKIHVKDLSLEIPHAPRIYLERDAPEINVQLDNKNECFDDGMYEVILTGIVTAKVKDKIMFLVEAHQAGIFQVRNIAEEEIKPVLGITCPNILFPYLRETVSDIVTRAGFPAILLNPVNFEAIYQRNQRQNQAVAEQSD